MALIAFGLQSPNVLHVQCANVLEMSQEAGPSNMRLFKNAFSPTLDSEIEKKKDALCVHKNLAVNVREKYFYPSVS